jgi:SAM-dependent methyltransferase
VEQVEKVFNFFATYQGFRTTELCSIELCYDIQTVRSIKAYLYKKGKLGAYSLNLTGSPHNLMRKFIHDKFEISHDSLILEVGPGANPLFPKEFYKNSVSIDKFGIKGQKLLFGNVKFKESTADFLGSYSTLDNIPELTEIVKSSGGLDVVAGCHSFEHETRPLKSLRNIHNVLRNEGTLILFVPDGWSDDITFRSDPTHTLNLTPPMIYEFFDSVEGFKDVSIEPFRPNFDIIISARKI